MLTLCRRQIFREFVSPNFPSAREMQSRFSSAKFSGCYVPTYADSKSHYFPTLFWTMYAVRYVRQNEAKICPKGSLPFVCDDAPHGRSSCVAHECWRGRRHGAGGAPSAPRLPRAKRTEHCGKSHQNRSGKVIQRSVRKHTGSNYLARLIRFSVSRKVDAFASCRKGRPVWRWLASLASSPLTPLRAGWITISASTLRADPPRFFPAQGSEASALAFCATRQGNFLPV